MFLTLVLVFVLAFSNTVYAKPLFGFNNNKNAFVHYDEYPDVIDFEDFSDIPLYFQHSENGKNIYFYDIGKNTKQIDNYISELKENDFIPTDPPFNLLSGEPYNFLTSLCNKRLVLSFYEYESTFIICISELNSIEDSGSDKIKVTVKGEELVFDQDPVTINNRVLVPIRLVAEKLNCKVEWDEKTQTVYINKSNVALQKKAVKSNEINVYVNNEAVIFDEQPPVNINGRILIPIRNVVEKLGYTVGWSEAAKTISIK